MTKREIERLRALLSKLHIEESIPIIRKLDLHNLTTCLDWALDNWGNFPVYYKTMWKNPKYANYTCRTR